MQPCRKTVTIKNTLENNEINKYDNNKIMFLFDM